MDAQAVGPVSWSVFIVLFVFTLGIGGIVYLVLATNMGEDRCPVCGRTDWVGKPDESV